MVGPFVWNPNAGRYIDALGRFVSREEVRQALDFALDNAQRRMLFTAEQFRAGRIPLSAWRDGMIVDLKALHLYSGAAARGGFAQMGPADYGRVGRELRRQYAHLNRFVAQIQSGDLTIDGRFLNRVKLYAQSGRVSYTEADRVVQRQIGMAEMRNVLGLAEHCDDCVDMTDLGWVQLDADEYIPIGSRVCLTNCKCHEQFR